MPDARNILVAPMIVEGRTVGAIVVEHRARRRTGVERRVAAMLGQFASIAALNLRNAVLLQHVQDLAERDSLTGAANRRMFHARARADPPRPRRPDRERIGSRRSCSSTSTTSRSSTTRSATPPATSSSSR